MVGDAFLRLNPDIPASMFRKRLPELAEAFPDRFNVRHVGTTIEIAALRPPPPSSATSAAPTSLTLSPPPPPPPPATTTPAPNSMETTAVAARALVAWLRQTWFGKARAFLVVTSFLRSHPEFKPLFKNTNNHAIVMEVLHRIEKEAPLDIFVHATRGGEVVRLLRWQNARRVKEDADALRLADATPNDVRVANEYLARAAAETMDPSTFLASGAAASSISAPVTVTMNIDDAHATLLRWIPFQVIGLAVLRAAPLEKNPNAPFVALVAHSGHPTAGCLVLDLTSSGMSVVLRNSGLHALLVDRNVTKVLCGPPRDWHVFQSTFETYIAGAWHVGLAQAMLDESVRVSGGIMAEPPPPPASWPSIGRVLARHKLGAGAGAGAVGSETGAAATLEALDALEKNESNVRLLEDGHLSPTDFSFLQPAVQLVESLPALFARQSSPQRSASAVVRAVWTASQEACEPERASS